MARREVGLRPVGKNSLTHMLSYNLLSVKRFLLQKIDPKTEIEKKEQGEVEL